MKHLDKKGESWINKVEGIPYEEENINGGYDSRTRVLGGWIVKSKLEEETGSRGYEDFRQHFIYAMTFVPDPDHKWKIAK